MARLPKPLALLAFRVCSIARMMRAAPLVSLVATATLAFAAPASARLTVDLLSDANIPIDGAAAGDQAGLSVSDAGDVNTDRVRADRGDRLIGCERVSRR